jgi:hypothetical protein
MGALALTAVCATPIAKRFMSTLVTETVPESNQQGTFGTICVVATGCLQIVAGKAQRQLIVRVL